MTKFLLRIFIGKNPYYKDPPVRAAVGRLSGMVGIVCNLLLCTSKLVVGLLSGSVSIMADAMNNLMDSVSSVVTLVGFKLAEKPADKDHPYGHARYEYLSGLAVAALILIIGFELAKTSVEKIISPAEVSLSVPMVLILVGSIAMKLWLSLFNRHLGKNINSGALQATAADSRNDVIATAAALVGAVVQAKTGWAADGIIGLGVALFILYSGVTMAKETISPLLGEAASPELRQLIIETIHQDPLVLNYHDLMVHDYGPGQRFASIHVEMDRREDPLLCHEVIDRLERLCLEKHNIHLVVHYDPVVVDDPELDRMYALVGEILRDMDSRLSIHDFRMVQGPGAANLIFDISMPHDMAEKKDDIRQELDSALAAKNQGTYNTVITFDLTD